MAIGRLFGRPQNARDELMVWQQRRDAQEAAIKWRLPSIHACTVAACAGGECNVPFMWRFYSPANILRDPRTSYYSFEQVGTQTVQGLCTALLSVSCLLQASLAGKQRPWRTWSAYSRVYACARGLPLLRRLKLLCCWCVVYPRGPCIS